MRCETALCVGVAVLLAAFSPSAAQSPAPDQAPAFEAAMVKPNVANDGNRRAGFQPGGRFVGINVSLGMLIGAAFSTPDAMLPGFQITGGPAWINTDGFDIEAKADGATPPEQLRLMLRTLLQNRFKLQAHVETRQLPIYALVTARPDGRLGPQLRPSPGDCIYGAAANPAGLPRCEERFGPARMKARRFNVAAVTMDAVAARLSSLVARKVINRTKLPGTFDVDVEFSYVTPPLGTPGDQAPDGVSLFTALTEQLGLKLDADRGPVEMLVVDAAERPISD
jgi:uncharacterized protein (TIGR03435 family)